MDGEKSTDRYRHKDTNEVCPTKIVSYELFIYLTFRELLEHFTDVFHSGVVFSLLNGQIEFA